MSWFDPSYRDDLRGVGQYKDRQFHQLEREAELAKVTIGNLVILNRSSATKLGIIQEYVVIWLQLWPEARQEILHKYFPSGVEELVSAFINNHANIPRPTERIHFVAQVILVFPEQRERLLKEITPDIKRIGGIVHTLPQGLSREEFNEYHQLIGDLTIIGAKSAVIDQSGIIQVELQPLSKPISPAPSPLPDRSTL